MLSVLAVIGILAIVISRCPAFGLMLGVFLITVFEDAMPPLLLPLIMFVMALAILYVSFWAFKMYLGK